MSWGGAAANVVGGELQGWANVLERQNMFDQFRQQQALQQQYANAAQGIFGQNVQAQGSQQAQADLAQGAAQRRQNYTNVAATPLAFPVAGAASYNPQADAAYTQMMGNARAKLGAYSDWQLQQSLANIQNQEQLNQVINFAGGQARNVYPFQLYQAQHSMDDLAMIGAAISSIGGGAANYAQFAQAPQGGQPVPSYSAPFDPSYTYGTDVPASGGGGVDPSTGLSFSGGAF